MDVKVVQQPIPLRGVHWSTANRWIIATAGSVYIVTPQYTVAGRIPTLNEVVVGIEQTQNIEAVCPLDDLPASSFPYTSALAVLVSDSSLRIYGTHSNPDLVNWQEVGRASFGTGAEHICAIANTAISGEAGAPPLPVVACGSMGGKVTLVGLSGDGGSGVNATQVLTFETHASAVSHLAWLPHRAAEHPQSDTRMLAVCSADGTVQFWSVACNLSQATASTTVCGRDWRPVTAHDAREGLLVLAKLGLAIIVDMQGDSRSMLRIHTVALGVTQTIVTCAIDARRNRAYIGSYDFVVAVLAHIGGEWRRMPDEEAPLRDAMKKTIVRSFTTKFDMQHLFLRGMVVSPNQRYLTFVVDDQVIWDIATDGQELTRIHFHEFEDWTPEDTRHSLDRVASGECPGNLRYGMWDIVNGESVSTIAELAQYLWEKSTLEDSPAKRQQQLFILSLIGCILGDDRPKDLVAKARSCAVGCHVKALFDYMGTALREEGFVAKDADQAYLAQLDWVVNQPEYADIAGKLPLGALNNASDEAAAVNCPVCHKGMSLVSELKACCTNKHIFDLCSVTLDILDAPGSDQCSICSAKRRHVEDASSIEGLAGKILTRFPQCPFCQGSFYPAAI
ncbi:hypothetical protein GGF46_002915 [Coemansia sp. RSA 552]|nr:hypothetical protein GGF46_002915 [Coemansia sp. RSA 552]